MVLYSPYVSASTEDLPSELLTIRLDEPFEVIRVKEAVKRRWGWSSCFLYRDHGSRFLRNSELVEGQVVCVGEARFGGKPKKMDETIKDGEDEDLDRLLAEIDGPSSSKPPEEKLDPPEETSNSAELELDEATAKKAEKNKKKKLKRKLAKEGQQDEPPPPPTTAKNKPTSEAARRALEMLRRVEEAEAEQRQDEEEERMREENARLKALEDEKEAEAEKERKRLARVEKREKARKEGKLLSAKEKAALAKQQAIREQLQAQGFKIPDPSAAPSSKKIIDDRKNKRNKNKAKTTVKSEEDDDEVQTNQTKIETPPVQPTSQMAVVADNWDASSESSLESDDAKKEDEVTNEVEDIKTVKDLNPCVEIKEKNIRSPICCILGHVDTGKTKLLDKIRKTNVQDNEAGGITQQIGATFCPSERLKHQCMKVESDVKVDVPGLLIIDTPGHESFNNLRARGSSLCDIAVLVIDVMHGLEPQTKESLGLLRSRNCPFIIALNKIDRMYGWKTVEWTTSRNALSRQSDSAKNEFDKRLNETLCALQTEGMNTALYWENSDIKKIVNIVPCSALTGEGLPDILHLLIQLTQDVMYKTLQHLDSFQCTILEVKSVDGLGITIDVILANGYLQEGEEILICGMNGPIHTVVKALLTPQPMKEIRVKGEFIHHKIIHAAMGIKIAAQGLDEAVAGTSVMKLSAQDDLEECKKAVMRDMTSIFDSVDRSGCGVYVMASTLGSLEALLQFLKTSNIPVFAVNIGTVHKMDVKRASIMREKDHPELAVVLAFDIKVDVEAEKEAKSLGVKIMTADIIYHLFDEFTAYLNAAKAEKKRDKAGEAVFPCQLTVIPQYVFNKKDPIVLGVKVDQGILAVNTPLAVPDKENLRIGRVSSLEHNKKPVERATRGMEVAVKITGDPSITFGRHFDHTNKLYSRVTRDSIDCLKQFFRDDLTNDDWKLMIQLKKIFEIV